MTTITKDGEYTTRSGNKVKIYATAYETGDRVHGAIDVGGIWVSDSWHPEGSYYKGVEHYNDLIPKPKVHKIDFWMNIYPDGEMGWKESSRELADKNAAPTRIACLHIQREFFEGEGLGDA